MLLKVLGSSSSGNCYILENHTEALIIEAGVSFKEILRNVDHKKIVGCLVSHEHKDHAKYLDDYRNHGIEIIAPFEDHIDLSGIVMGLGGFNIKTFENHHNVECYGFYMHHKDIGNLVFSTDTGYIEYKFRDINHYLIECNYSKEILDQRVENGFDPHLADRIVKDHMSLETCKEFFQVNDLSKTRNVVLLHLSDSNSNAEQFQAEIHELTKKQTYIADKGLEVDLSLCPF